MACAPGTQAVLAFINTERPAINANILASPI
jgi:hypothetical protein